MVVLIWFSLTFVTESSKVKVKNMDGTILENDTKAIVEKSVKIGDDVKIYNNTFFNFLPSDKQNPYENTDRALGYDGLSFIKIFPKVVLQIVFLGVGFIYIHDKLRPNNKMISRNDKVRGGFIWKNVNLNNNYLN